PDVAETPAEAPVVQKAPATPEPPTALSAPEVVPLMASAAPEIFEPATPVPIVQPTVAAVAKPKRNSTPVELARTLAAERAAHAPAEAKAGGVIGRTSGSRQALRSLREHARARAGIADLLMFRIAGERFAVELLAVDEVIDLPVLHHVPEMPPAMLGVVTVRGSLTPVYSPHHALGLPLAMRDALLIFRRGASRLGVLIDDVEDAISLDLSDLRDAPGANDAENVVLGVIRHGDSLVGIIDAEALIAACQTAALQEIA
ncbi:MAG: chemotaxis protein CheW, partial [bacterium]